MTRHHKKDEDYARLVHAQVLWHLARVHVHVIALVVDVVCLMPCPQCSFCGSCCIRTVFVAIFCSWRCTLYTSRR